jgi:hypothetical protein
MLTTTAMVLLTITATVSPTARPTMTAGEQGLFNQLVECGVLADKAQSESYEAGYKDGRHDQYCFVQCRILITEKKFLQRKIESDAKEDQTLLSKIGLASNYISVHKYEDDVEDTKQIIKKNGCDCSQYEDGK